MNVRTVLRKKRTDYFNIRLVVRVIIRIGLRHPEHETLLNVAGVNETEELEFALATLNKVIIGRVPQVVSFKNEVFETQASASFFNQIRRPGSEVLDTPHLHFGGVDINPVIRERTSLRHYEGHGEKVTVTKIVTRSQYFAWERRVERVDKLSHRH